MFGFDVAAKCVRCSAPVNVAPGTCERLLTAPNAAGVYVDLAEPCEACGGKTAHVELSVTFGDDR